MKKEQCFISNKEFPIEELMKGHYIRAQLMEIIKKDFPEFSKDSYISITNLNIYRKKYLQKLLETGIREIGELERDIIDKISGNKILNENIEPDIDVAETIGQKIADRVASFGGSWSFIIIFFAFLLLWIGINIWFLTTPPFDPYPFILLNLILSSLAAIQAPVIMMSQNRQEEKDRKRGEHDYKINLKSELEIQLLNEKMDHLISHQNKRMLEIQELQLDFMEEISNKMNKESNNDNN